MKKALLTAIIVSVIFVAIAMNVQSTKAQIAIAVTSNSTQISVNNTIQFSARVTGGMLGFTIKWYNNGVLVTGATSPIWNESIWDFTPISSGKYSITASVTDVLNYQATSTKIVTVLASPLPSPSPSQSPSSTPTMTASLSESASALNYGNKVNFTVSVDGGVSPFTFAWYIDNQLVENSSSQYFSTNSQAVGSHHVYVQVTDADNNSATTLAVEFNVLSGSSSSPVTSTSPSSSPSSSSSPTQRPTPNGEAERIRAAYLLEIGIAIIIVIAIIVLVFFRTRKK